MIHRQPEPWLLERVFGLTASASPRPSARGGGVDTGATARCDGGPRSATRWPATSRRAHRPRWRCERR
jgi:hypothetical protein